MDLFAWLFRSHPFSSVFYVIFVWQLKLLTLLLNYLFQLTVLIYKSISLLSDIPCHIILFLFQTCNSIFFYIFMVVTIGIFSEVLFYLLNCIHILWVIFLFYLLLVSIFYVSLWWSFTGCLPLKLKHWESSLEAFCMWMGLWASPKVIKQGLGI